jgi:class 3 adenylate cyclase/tetratricopeptide (TPR) repeat protein
MKCRKCQFENPADAKFCNECGSKLELVCPQCTKANPAGSKFCNECGQSLAQVTSSNDFQGSSESSQSPSMMPEAAPLSEGERRQATVVFSDLSGYTSMSEKLDPEEVQKIMSRIKKEAVHIFERHEGIVNQFVGDEVLALFGIPAANEDDPVRAVKAAKELHEVVRQISPEVEDLIGTQLRMHSGISSGLIVTHLRDIRDGSYGITGDTVNIGARLANRAEADEVLVSPETFRQITPYFETETLEEIIVKGKTQPLIPYRVIKESNVQTRFEAAEQRGFTSFTGRQQELTALYSCLDKAMSGDGQFVTVVGEAGMGKSRLVYEFRHSLNHNTITVLQGRCQSHGTRIPYFPLINALRRGLNLSDEDTPAELHEKVVSNAIAIDQTLEQYLPIYLYLLSISSETYPLPAHLKGQELINEIQKALAAIITLNTKTQPMVLLLEDWHWADEASDSALKHLVSVITSYPLMLLAIYRPEYSSNWANWSHHTPIILRALDGQTCQDFIKSVWSAERLPEGIGSLIHERTGGNPFFMEEISSALIEDGTIQVKDRQARLTRSLDKLTLPDTVQAVIRSRLDRLDQYSRESMRLASVIGREFTRRILEQISSFKKQLSQSLETLKVLELIQQIRVVPEMEYMFKHVITQEVTYDTLLHQQRKELHGLVGQAIEEVYQDRVEEQVDILHHHFKRAGNWSKAVKYGRLAANRAYRLSQFQGAVAVFEQTKSCLLHLPDDRSRQETLLDILLEMIWPLHFTGDQDQAIEICKEAEPIAQSLKDRVRLGKVHYEFGLSHFMKNQYQLAENYFLKIMELPENAETKAFINSIKFPLATIYFSLVQWQKAADLYTEVINSHEASDRQSEYLKEMPFMPYTHSCHHLGYIRALQGRIQETKMLLEKGYTPALEQVSNLQSRAWCALWHSAFATLIGEEYGSLARAEKVLGVVEGSDSPILLFVCYAAKGNALAADMQLEDARTFYEKAVKAVKNTPHRRYLEAVYCNLVQIALELNDRPAAERYYKEGFPLVELNPERDAPRFDFLKARLLTGSDSPDFEKAETLFTKSIQADQKSGTVLLAAQTRLYLAQMFAQKGETERSVSLLNEALDQFKEWGVSIWQQKCELTLIRLEKGKVR